MARVAFTVAATAAHVGVTRRSVPLSCSSQCIIRSPQRRIESSGALRATASIIQNTFLGDTRRFEIYSRVNDNEYFPPEILSEQMNATEERQSKGSQSTLNGVVNTLAEEDEYEQYVKGKVESLQLEDFRADLMRQEETIIFALIERAQFAVNKIVYEDKGLAVPGWEGSFMGYMLCETEKIHAKVRRYTAPEETPFFPDSLPQPILPLLTYSKLIIPNNINVNEQIFSAYLNEVLPAICPPGDDSQYGSSTTADVQCLQALSKRIHYGKFIAEAKFQESTTEYCRMIREKDADGLMRNLSNLQVEEKLLRRVRYKAQCYGRDIDSDPESWVSSTSTLDALNGVDHKLDPEFVVDAYRNWIIPLTKTVEVMYLLQRLDAN